MITQVCPVKSQMNHASQLTFMFINTSSPINLHHRPTTHPFFARSTQVELVVLMVDCPFYGRHAETKLIHGSASGWKHNKGVTCLPQAFMVGALTGLSSGSRIYTHIYIYMCSYIHMLKSNKAVGKCCLHCGWVSEPESSTQSHRSDTTQAQWRSSAAKHCTSVSHQFHNSSKVQTTCAQDAANTAQVKR